VWFLGSYCFFEHRAKVAVQMRVYKAHFSLSLVYANLCPFQAVVTIRDP